MKSFKKFFALFLALVLTATGSITADISSNAASDGYEQYLLNLGFPESYVTKLSELHEIHPTWNFVPLIVSDTWGSTSYNWDYIISVEDVAPKNLIYPSSTYSAYRDETNTTTYDSGWYQVSLSGLEYFMDPRNFLNEYDIFMFESLSWTDSFTVENIETALSGTFMSGATCDNGLSYAQTIYEAAQASNINPMFLASRLKQENSSGNSAMVKGTTGTTLYGYVTSGDSYTSSGNAIWGDYTASDFSSSPSSLLIYDGYYNLFNIGAGGDGMFAIYYNGIKTAYSKGWTSHTLSIYGGADSLATNYINKYQDTIYLQKFNVDGNSPYGLGAHQYMQNVGAPLSEGRNTRSTYYSEGLIDYGHTFEIPVYDSMPSSCPDPANGATSYAAKTNGDFVIDPANLVFDSDAVTDWLATGVASGYTESVTFTTDYTANGYDSYAKITSPSLQSSDPQVNLIFSSIDTTLSADTYKYMIITARTSASITSAAAYLCAGSITSPTESCVTFWEWNNDGLWHEYVIDLSALSSFTGDVNMIRLDYFNDTTPASSELDLRSIRFSASKPSQVSLSASSPAYYEGADIILNYSGVSDRYGIAEDHRPFVALYNKGEGPGTDTALMWQYITDDDSSLSFPSDAAGGSSVGYLPEGEYTAWIGFDSYGVMCEYSLSNAYFADTEGFDIKIVSADAQKIIKVDVGVVSSQTSVYTEIGATYDEIITDAYVQLAASSVTLYNADGSSVTGSSTVSTGMTIVADGVSYPVLVSGDVNGDGAITITDAQLVLGHVRGTAFLSGCYADAGLTDYSRSSVNIIDVTTILNSVLN